MLKKIVQLSFTTLSRISSGISLKYIRQLGEALPYIVAMEGIKILPAAWAQKIFQFIADKLADKPKFTTKLRENLAQVLGVPSAQVSHDLIRAAMRSYLRYWLEVCRLPVMDKSYIQAHTKTQHWDRAEPDVLARKGVIFVLPHSGNWDMAGVWYLQYADTLYTVNERVKPELLYQKFVHYRESLGFSILPHNEHPYDTLVQQLRSGATVCLLVDRIVGAKQAELDIIAEGSTPDDVPAVLTQVNFFDKPVWVTTGPVRLAKDTLVRLFAVYPSFTPEGWCINFSAAIDLQRGYQSAMQEIMDFFAENIREKPEDWHAMQRIWKNSS